MMDPVVGARPRRDRRRRHTDPSSGEAASRAANIVDTRVSSALRTLFSPDLSARSVTRVAANRFSSARTPAQPLALELPLHLAQRGRIHRRGWRRRRVSPWGPRRQARVQLLLRAPARARRQALNDDDVDDALIGSKKSVRAGGSAPRRRTGVAGPPPRYIDRGPHRTSSRRAAPARRVAQSPVRRESAAGTRPAATRRHRRPDNTRRPACEVQRGGLLSVIQHRMGGAASFD